MDRRERLPRLGDILTGTRADDGRWPLVLALAAELAVIGLSVASYWP